MHRSRLSAAAVAFSAVVIALSGCQRSDDGPDSGAAGAPAPAGDERAAKLTALQTRIGELQAQAQLVADANDVKRLQRTYGYYVDQGSWDAVADLFSDTGTIEIGQRGVYVGKARVREFLYALYNGKAGLQDGQLNEHMQFQPVVDVAPDGMTARGRWRAFIMSGQFGERASWSEGPYENEYVKQNGIWKISKLHWYETFAVPFEGGWARNRSDDPARRTVIGITPDLPPTENVEPWPAVYFPPFHYANPGNAASADEIVTSTVLDADPEIAAVQGSVDRLAQRVQLLKDADAIENLISIYGYYLDKAQWDDLTAIFSENARLEVSLRGVYVGRKRIREAFELFGPQPLRQGYLHNHIQVQPVVHVAADGKTAYSRSRAISELGTYERVGVWGDGVYGNEFVKENGVWRISSDHVYTTFFSTYDEGFIRGARAAPRPSADIPPDLPSTELYESLPGVYLPPFQYAHPVTGQPIQGATVKVTDLKFAPESSALLPEVAALDHVLARLEDENAIENLQRTYGFFVDKGLWTEASQLFAADGTLEIGGRGVFVGPARVLEYMKFLGPEGPKYGRLINHLQLQPVIHVADDGLSAKGRWHFLAQGGDTTSEGVPADSPGVLANGYLGMGVYENEYVKDSGVWKIKTLHSYFRMYTRDNEGWAKTALPMTRPEAALPPDRPPTVVYDMYPATFMVPFHYPHPVTGAQ